MLEHHCKYCYFWATVSKKLNFLLGFLTFQNPACEKPCRYCHFWPRARTQHETGNGAGRDQSFYPQIPFSSQPQFREPISQGYGKNGFQHAQPEHEQARTHFRHFLILGISSPRSLILWIIYKGKRHLSKIHMYNLRIPKIQISICFSILGILSPISPMLWRIYEGEINWIYGSEHRLSMHTQAEHEQAPVNKQMPAIWGVGHFKPYFTHIVQNL